MMKTAAGKLSQAVTISALELSLWKQTPRASRLPASLASLAHALTFQIRLPTLTSVLTDLAHSTRLTQPELSLFRLDSLPWKPLMELSEILRELRQPSFKVPTRSALFKMMPRLSVRFRRNFDTVWPSL